MIDVIEPQLLFPQEMSVSLKCVMIGYLKERQDYIVHEFDRYLSMKELDIKTIVNDLQKDNRELREYPASLLFIVCDALAIRGSIVSHDSISTTFYFSDSTEKSECRDADVVVMAAESTYFALKRTRRKPVVYCPLLDYFFRKNRTVGRSFDVNKLIMGKNMEGKFHVINN